MKKILPAIILSVLLFSCFSFTVFAQTPNTISEDYQTLVLDDDVYHRVDISVFDMYHDAYYETFTDQISLSEAQQDAIKNIDLSSFEDGNLRLMDITFYDGAMLSVYFLHEDYISFYEDVTSGQVSDYIIDFEWPKENTVDTTRTELFNNHTILSEHELQSCDYFPVVTRSEDKALTAYTGTLVTVDGTYYYIDTADAGLDNKGYLVPYDYTELSAYEITDDTLLADIEEGIAKYHNDDLGYLYNDDLSDIISAVFLIFVFGIIPFVIMILFLIFAIRSKTSYKKLFRTIYLLSAAELIIFAVLTSIIIMN